MSNVDHGLWMMDLVWSWHVFSMKWLISKWHGIDMKYNSIFMVWEGWVGVDSTFGYEWGWVIKVGMRLYAWWISLYCLIMIGCCQCVIPWAS